MKLHTIKHDLKTTLWCGPAALSAISGEPTSRIHDIIKKIRGDNKPVMGVRNRELVKAAFVLGYTLVPIYDWLDLFRKAAHGEVPKKPTLAKFVRENRAELALPVVINVTGHYVIVHRRLFVDNGVNPSGIRLKTAPHRRARVRRAWRVVPVCKPLAPVGNPCV